MQVWDLTSSKIWIPLKYAKILLFYYKFVFYLIWHYCVYFKRFWIIKYSEIIKGIWLLYILNLAAPRAMLNATSCLAFWLESPPLRFFNCLVAFDMAVGDALGQEVGLIDFPLLHQMLEIQLRILYLSNWDQITIEQ